MVKHYLEIDLSVLFSGESSFSSEFGVSDVGKGDEATSPAP